MDDQVTLTREVEVTLIPQGTPMTLPEGETVTITHRLGGNFTVMTHNGMFRVSGANADALGEEVSSAAKSAEAEGGNGPVNTADLWEALKTVFDQRYRSTSSTSVLSIRSNVTNAKKADIKSICK